MTAEFSSPACSLGRLEDAELGYAPLQELQQRLNVLLEAELAGARVCHDSAHGADGAALGELLRSLQADEAQWCAMLAGHIRACGGTPSSRVGDFYEKAMAVAELPARMALLNRGQGWVVRKLRELLLRVRDESLRADLQRMLDSHEANIARVTVFYGPSQPAP
jgi:hypothetical protein